MVKKKMILGSILFLSVMTLSNPVWASSSSCYDMTGAYVVDGSLKMSVSFPDYVTASISLPKLGNLGDVSGEVFYFFDDGTLGDELLYSSLGWDYFAYWDQNGCTFTIDYTELADYLLQTLYDAGVDAEITGSTTVTGKIASNGSNSGKFSININIYSPLEGKLSVSMSFKGYPASSLASLPKGGSPSIKAQVKDFMSKFLSSLPRKGTGRGGPPLLKSH